MTKFAVLFFASVVASTAVQGPQDAVMLLTGIFKNGAIPTDASVHAAFQEAISLVKNLFANQIAPLPDIHETFVDEHGHLIKVDLTNGQFTGLANLYSNVASTARVKNNYGLLLAPYKYPNLEVSYNYAVKHNDERKEGKIFAVEFLKCDFGLLIDRYTLKISSHNIKCEKDGPTNIQLEGKTKEDKHNKKVIKATVPIFKALIDNATKQNLKQLFISILNDYNANL